MTMLTIAVPASTHEAWRSRRRERSRSCGAMPPRPLMLSACPAPGAAKRRSAVRGLRRAPAPPRPLRRARLVQTAHRCGVRSGAGDLGVVLRLVQDRADHLGEVVE